jgi:hypothetical protein
MNIGSSGSVMANRYNYYDLDPTYRNAFGQPLMRMTFDYKENEHKIGRHARAGRQRHREVDEPDAFNRRRAHRAVDGRALPEHAQHRRHRSWAPARDERVQQVPAELGCHNLFTRRRERVRRTTRRTTRPGRWGRLRTGLRTRSSAMRSSRGCLCDDVMSGCD